MRFLSIGMRPSEAINRALYIYYEAEEDERVKLLLGNKTPVVTLAKHFPKVLQSEKTIDLNLNELLGIGLVSAYYDWVENGKEELYQAVVGIEDAVKSRRENYLSDGGVYQNSTRRIMIYQQTLVQGFDPSKKIISSDLTQAIQHKVSTRYKYPDNCGLIVNLYSTDGDINLKEIIENTNFNSYQKVFVIWYNMPDLDRAIVFDLIKNAKNGIETVNKMNARLARFPMDNEATFDYSRSSHYWKE